MDQQVGRDRHTTFDQQTAPEQRGTLEQQTAIEQEPNSDQFQPIPPDQITQEGNEAYLRQHQRHLRSTYPSCDLSEVSYHTEQTDFPGSRHSSLNTEPLTLDADQIHDAKDQAADVMQRVDTDTAFDLFTQDLQTKSEEALSQEPEAQALAAQINTLVEKAQQVVEINDQQQSGNQNPGAASASLEGKKDGPEDPAVSVEEDVKLKAE